MLLYKFRTMQDFAFVADILVNERLYCSNYDELNDPFEGQFLIEISSYDEISPADFDPEIPEVIRREPSTKEHLQQFLDPHPIPRICSLSANVTDLKMWAFYAGGHTGLAIEIETECGLVVEYPSDLPVYDHRVLDLPTLEGAYRIFLRKTPDWAYEEEHRIISVNEFFSIKGKIRAVVFGDRFPKDKIAILQRLAPPGVKWKVAKLVHQEARIEITEVLRQDI